MSMWTRIAMAIIGIVLGFALGSQIRTALAIQSQLRIVPEQLQELAYQLHQRERARVALESQVQELRARLTTYENAIAAEQVQLKRTNLELQRLKFFAGVTPVEGPGVVVEMDDSPKPQEPGENPNEWILHNFDVVDVVNELWAAGAEAIAINGERIVATTPIRSVATTMMVNTRRLNPPLRIEAVGDPARLAGYLERRGGFVGLLRAFTFPVDIRRADRLLLPAYRGPFVFRYAVPVRSR